MREVPSGKSDGHLPESAKASRFRGWRVPFGAHWSVGDQALSSATNLTLSVLIASTNSAQTFGASGVIVAAYLLEVTVLRGAVGDLYTIDSAGKGGLAERRQAIGATTILAVGLAIVHAVAGFALGGTLQTLLLVFAFLTPGLLLQDSARVLLLAQGQPRQSFESNVVWTVIQAVGSTIVYFTTQSAAGFLMAWGMAATGSAVYSLVRIGALPNPVAGITWFRRFRGVSAGWALEYFATSAPAQLLTWAVGAIAGLEELAAYRGALVLVGPSTVLVGGIRIVSLPAAATMRHNVDGLRRLVHRIEIALCTSALITTLPLVAMPDVLGRGLLGASWAGAERVLVFVVLDRVAAATAVASVIGLRVARAHRQLLLLRAFTAFPGLGFGIMGSVWAGAMGSAAGYGFVTVVTLPLWRRSYKRVIDQLDRGHVDNSALVSEVGDVQEPPAALAEDRLAGLAGGLHSMRCRLDRFEALGEPSQADAAAWRMHLRAYDEALVAAAKVLGVPVPDTRGGLTREHRADLEAGLAAAGLNVRAGPA
jgi:hypothetical protein